MRISWSKDKFPEDDKKKPGDALSVLVLHTPFDDEKAFDLYLKYYKSGDPADLNAAFEAALPVYGRFLRRGIRRFNPPSELLSPVAWGFYKNIKRRKLLIDRGVSGFVSGLWWICFRTASRYRKAMKDNQTFNRHWNWYCRGMPYGRVEWPEDAQARIFLEEIPKLIAENVLKRLRFKQKEYKKACSHILYNILTNRRSFTGQMAHQLDIPRDRVKFLVDYVKVQIRSYLYEIKAEFDEAVMSDWREIFDYMDLDRFIYTDLNEDEFEERFT